MWRRAAPADFPALTPKPGASPGLLRRRYSVPETVMRKYRLAQLSSEETNRSSVETCSCCALPEPVPRMLRRDREVMRRSALLRRLHGRSCRACCCGGCNCSRTTRSLEASHSELRPPSAARRSPVSGRTSPKRLRLDSSSPRDSRVVLSAPSTELTLSDSSSRSNVFGVFSCTDTDAFAVSSTSESDYRDATDAYIQCSASSMDAATPGAIVGTDSTACCGDNEENSFADSSDTYSTSMCTAKETIASMIPNVAGHIVRTESIDGTISERTASVDNEDGNVLPYDRPLTVETPPYEILEIVVSETLNTVHTPMTNIDFSGQTPSRSVKSPAEQYKRVNDARNTNLDEYVSNILVESLNSLTDQLESMNASIGANKKLSIIEKEIKVKLQNTGVNTIVHLSPTSNNQIIFGHEELCSSDERRDSCNNIRNSSVSPAIRDELHSVETNNNLTSADSLPRPTSSDHQPESFTNVIQSDNVNKAVLQQIQKLFQDDLQNMESDTQYTNENMPSISHIEISDVDVYIDNNGSSYSKTGNELEKQAQMDSESSELIGSVNAGNYYENARDNTIVPRFSAFPHTDSMEVNTSSSDDAEVIGSECASLVDSLDDPNSPRSIMLRKSGNSSKRSELVRSSIDVLDLLPENAYQTESATSKEKGESFFVRIKDDDCECDCEKKNIVVADHMPETIKQRLYKRHRKRELRMECARRSKVKQLRRELEKQRQSELRKSKKEIERECKAIINALIDNVISKITQEEFKCMRIKQKSVLMVSAKSDESLSRKNWKKDIELNNNKLSKNNTTKSCSEGMNKKYRKAEKFQIRGKLSLQTYPSVKPDDNNPKRIYQKSEIHDGKKCIEILEILEYVNNSSTSSPETGNSDDNQNAKYKKSRIPIPVSERTVSQNSNKSGSSTGSRTQLFLNRNDKISAPNISQNMFANTASLHIHSPPRSPNFAQSPRRASVPHCEPRPRSNSLRFKRVFDMIPEERSSLSVESLSEDLTHSRRASAPTLADGLLLANDEIGFRMNQFIDATHEQNEHLKLNPAREIIKMKEMRSAGTSPMPSCDVYSSVFTQTRDTMRTSPLQRSTGTSPIRNLSTSTQTPLPRKKSTSSENQPKLQLQRHKNQYQQHVHSYQPQSQRELQHHQRQEPRFPRQRMEPVPAPRQRVDEGTRTCAPPLLAHRTASTIPVE